jgi:hypothetical protein
MFKESFEGLITNLHYVEFSYCVNDNEEVHEIFFQVIY